ncbi:hypothetical protein JTB14_029789 [Gonioctena quinquepunctata]|nr:hypothetical protein JTB14_029789 [Gonioctena quinquepunctata]
MNSKRFKKITEALHCNNNESCPARGSPQYDKLHKIRPMIEFLNQKCRSVWECSSVVSVDESMIPFKGRCSFKQYMPMKPADSKTGFISKFDIYTGKNTEKSQNKDFGLGEKVVINLTEGFPGKKSLVAFDNFFASVPLLKELYRKGIQAVGTVRTTRKGLPEMMKEKVSMNRGEFQFESKG